MGSWHPGTLYASLWVPGHILQALQQFGNCNVPIRFKGHRLRPRPALIWETGSFVLAVWLVLDTGDKAVIARGQDRGMTAHGVYLLKPSLRGDGLVLVAHQFAWMQWTHG